MRSGPELAGSIGQGPRAAYDLLSLFQSLLPEPRAIDSKHLAITIADILHHQQATDIALLDVSGPLVIADCFVIATAKNARHARALATEVDQALRASGRRHVHAAGLENENSWVLLDYDDVVLHVFLGDARAFYGLENLWADVPRIAFTPSVQPAREVSVPDPSIGVL